MRVKIWEWVVSILFVAYGLAMVITEDYHFHGFPIPDWIAYALVLAGVLIPIFAFFHRKT